jgi:NitT/TauT family transport system substrate-binding protein
VNPKFATDHPDAVKGFLRAFVKSLKSTAKDPAAAVDSVVKRNEAAKKDVELERLNMALHDNILTPEARAEGLGGVDGARFDKAIDQIALTYGFKARPRSSDIFDSTSLPPAADRVVD